MNKGIVRIKDIAEKANVSVGTVDRVIHNRGRVSEEARQKVLQTLQELDYQPNLIARTLGANRSYRIAALIPDPDPGPVLAGSPPRHSESHSGMEAIRRDSRHLCLQPA